MEARTREAQRTLLFLTIPAEVGVRAGPVTVLWPDGVPVNAEVLGADFTGPDAFMAERESFKGLLEACRAALEYLTWRACEHGPLGAQLRAAIARATAPTPDTEAERG
jgi:hypothetical protein